MKFNLSELIIGAFFGASGFLILGPWTVLTTLVCSFFWALSGGGASKLFRRLGCGAVVFSLLYFITKNPQFLYSNLGSFAVLSLGYGIPDNADEGSFLGRIFYKIFHSDRTATIFTRLTIAALLALSFIPVYQVDKIHIYTVWFMLSAGKLIGIFCPQREYKLGE